MNAISQAETCISKSSSLKLPKQTVCPAFLGNEGRQNLTVAATVQPSKHLNANADSPAEDLHDSKLLNTHFLSASSALWDVVDKDRSLYSMTMSLKAAPKWMPVICPDPNGMRHTSVSSERFLLDWARLEEYAKTSGQSYFSYPCNALRSAQGDDWKQTETINSMIQSGKVYSRYKSATTVMVSVPGSPYSAVGDVMNIKMVADKPGVSAH